MKTPQDNLDQQAGLAAPVFSDEDLDILAEFVKALVDIDLEIKEGADNAAN